MSYIIIVLIIAIVLGPIMWMMPTPKQRRLTALRQYALEQGLSIRVCDLPQSHTQRVRKESAQKGVMYSLPLIIDRPSVMKKAYCLSRTSDNSQLEWQGQAYEQAEPVFKEMLALCPAAVVALEYSPAGVGCYWQEHGGVEVVSEIKAILSSFRDKLKSLEAASE